MSRQTDQDKLNQTPGSSKSAVQAASRHRRNLRVRDALIAGTQERWHQAIDSIGGATFRHTPNSLIPAIAEALTIQVDLPPTTENLRKVIYTTIALHEAANEQPNPLPPLSTWEPDLETLLMSQYTGPWALGTARHAAKQNTRWLYENHHDLLLARGIIDTLLGAMDALADDLATWINNGARGASPSTQDWETAHNTAANELGYSIYEKETDLNE